MLGVEQMTGLKFFAPMPFGITAFMTMLSETGVKPDFLQYGALGLCAIIVIFLCHHITQLTNKLDRKDQVLGEMFQKNIIANERLTEALGDRPCLKNDHRIEQN